MKLSAKIVLSVIVIVALAVSFSGYLLVYSSFLTQLDNQIEAAADETQLLCATLGTLALQQGAQLQAQPEATLQKLLDQSFFRGYRLQLADGTDMGSDAVHYRVESDTTESGEKHFDVVVTAQLLLMDHTFYLENRRDVTPVYALRDQNLTNYRYIFLGAVGASLLMGIAISGVLTSPIRKLSRSARAIAAGQYSSRAKVNSADEIGTLAEQFNRMADALEQHMEQLELAAKQQKDFTASFAHELKTPLTSIIGYADTLRSRRLTEGQQLEAAAFIFSEGKRLERMSHALLRLFSLDSEQPKMVPLSALSIARSVEQSVDYSLRQRKLVLELQVEDRQILAEGNLLSVLLYNLIDNARKASPPGRKITLLGGVTPKGYCFAVKDRGEGIPQEALSRITEPFYMVDKSRARAEGGAGIGLALCKKIAQLHGTQLHYDSKVGKGTVVSFFLPLGEESK